MFKRVTLIIKTISWYWSAGRHDQYIRKLSLGEIVQASLDLVQVSGAVENILSNGNAQSQHSTRVNTNDEIQAKKRKGICKDLVTKTILKSSSSLLLLLKVWEQVQYRLGYPPCIHHEPVDTVATVTPLTPEKFALRGRGRCNVCCLNPFPRPYFRPKQNKLLTLLLKF